MPRFPTSLHQDLTLVFADLEDSSRFRPGARRALREKLVPDAIEAVLAELYEEKLLYFRSWEYAWLFVLASSKLGVKLGLALRAYFTKPRKWSRFGFDHPPRLRCAVHTGEVEIFSVSDPIGGGSADRFVSDTFDLTERIELKTMPGRVWATVPVAESIRKDAGSMGIICESVGEMELAEGLEPQEIFDIRVRDTVALRLEDLEEYRVGLRSSVPTRTALLRENAKLRRQLERSGATPDAPARSSWLYIGEVAGHKNLETVKLDEYRQNLTSMIKARSSIDSNNVCVLYTGGTIGMIREDPDDEDSPLRTMKLIKVLPHLWDVAQSPYLTRLPFTVHFWELPEPLDSSNVGYINWIHFAHIIRHLFPFYQGFVVLHGTDTMAYTASALSFLLTNLGKPVILTGAEKPISEPTSDAPSNLVHSLRLAAPKSTALHAVPEVAIFFGTRLIRGNRAKKVHSLALQGFDSPNCPLLGTAEDEIEINRSVLLDREEMDELAVADGLRPRVALFEMYPNEKKCLKTLRQVISDKTTEGIILKTYGTGNAPTIPEEFLEAIKKAVDDGKIVVNITQCPVGQVQVRLFETNAFLFEYGVISGGDMTPEAAVCKLMFLLEKYSLAQAAAIREDMQINLFGELKYSVYSLRYSEGVSCAGAPFVGDPGIEKTLNPDTVSRALIRVHGVFVDGPSCALGLSFYYNLFKPIGQYDEAKLKEHHIDTVSREWKAQRGGISFNIDATTVVNRVNRKTQDRKHNIQVVTACSHEAEIKALELAFFTEDVGADALVS